VNRDDILRIETLPGNTPRVLELTREGLGAGPAPKTTLFDALTPSLEQAGARLSAGVFRAGRGAQAVVRRWRRSSMMWSSLTTLRNRSSFRRAEIR
jgi:hypothetical protein